MKTLAELLADLGDLDRKLQMSRRSAAALAHQSPTAALISAGAVARLEWDRERLLIDVERAKAATA
jgi:hypothetical protein